MAKWGEGDPRWILEKWLDAKNVNNCTEKNASHGSKEKFTEIPVGTKVETDFDHCERSEIAKRAVANMSMGRQLLLYEWSLDMKPSGALVNGDTTVKGSLEIPNLSEEHDMKDVDINVHFETTRPEADVLKDMVYEEEAVNFSMKRVLETGEIQTTETFKCTADEFYRAMTVRELVQAFTQGDCKLDVKEGGNFELFDGNVQGRFIRLVPCKEIQQKWRFKTWPEGHFSDVSFEINQKSDCTEVNVTQIGVPKTELDNTRDGWKRFYWNSMRRTLGFGALLF